MYVFYFGPIPSCIGAMLAIAACVKLLGGIAFYPEDSRLLTADQAVHYASDMVPKIVALEAELGRGPE
ncbi:hypothetical protein [Methylobacterium sp. NEAU K]|uniref:hypothetical protein n=1 Tax=Methylobacterium sp. NEAU K TaxID=3064946 RepID=UPI00273612E4|nr:hypothetical protein [Methylobacterium sp. NEAU K]MDP4004637.1 hypothetical protein [Methylobacterium sp. NEAU K]